MQVGKTKEGSGLPAKLGTKLDQYSLNLHGNYARLTLASSNLVLGVSEQAGRSTAGELPVPLSWKAKAGQNRHEHSNRTTHHHDGCQASSRHCSERVSAHSRSNRERELTRDAFFAVQSFRLLKWCLCAALSDGRRRRERKNGFSKMGGWRKAISLEFHTRRFSRVGKYFAELPRSPTARNERFCDFVVLQNRSLEPPLRSASHIHSLASQPTHSRQRSKR